jgi:hypothetical protein
MHPAENADRSVLDAYKWVAENTRGMPLTTMMVSYQRGSGVKFLSVTYMFNPETQAFRPLGTTSWDRARVAADRKQTRYVERLIAFGNAWAPVLEKGFSGKTIAPEEVASTEAAIVMGTRGYPIGLVDGDPNPAIDVKNVAAVPYLNDSGRKNYAEFITAKKRPRAFAIAENGAYGWATGRPGYVDLERALNNCRGRSNTSCKLYAVNDDVVWPAQ